MTSRERNAILIISTAVVLSIGRIFLEFDFINQKLWGVLTPRLIAENSILGAMILGVTYLFSKYLRGGPRILGFSWLKLIPALRRFAENIAALPLRLIAPLGITYMIVLTYMLPAIAYFEEFYSRGQITGFWSAVIVTLAFALVHLLAGATLGGSITLIIPGGFFALIYSVGGIVIATYLHVFYDIVAIAVTMAIYVKEKRAEHVRQVRSAVPEPA